MQWGNGLRQRNLRSSRHIVGKPANVVCLVTLERLCPDDVRSLSELLRRNGCVRSGRRSWGGAVRIEPSEGSRWRSRQTRYAMGYCFEVSEGELCFFRVGDVKALRPCADEALSGEHENQSVMRIAQSRLNGRRQQPKGNVLTRSVYKSSSKTRFQLQTTANLARYFSCAYSTLACFRMGMSGSASFQRAKKSW